MRLLFKLLITIFLLLLCYLFHFLLFQIEYETPFNYRSRILTTSCITCQKNCDNAYTASAYIESCYSSCNKNYACSISIELTSMGIVLIVVFAVIVPIIILITIIICVCCCRKSDKVENQLSDQDIQKNILKSYTQLNEISNIQINNIVNNPVPSLPESGNMNYPQLNQIEPVFHFNTNSIPKENEFQKDQIE